MNGGPAFPRAQGGDYGMTLRDYFAGQVVSTALDQLYKMGQMDGPFIPKVAAGFAYEMADAMLAERERNNP